jgi:predicted DNA-binding protein
MSTKSTGVWFFKAIPKEMMQRVKIAVAIEGRTVKDMVLELLEQHLKEMEKKGLLPKGK